MNSITHALYLPEIILEIAQFLEASDVLACSLVSKSFYNSFAPFVWQDLHFGQPCILNSDIHPFARHIHIHTDNEHSFLQHQQRKHQSPLIPQQWQHRQQQQQQQQQQQYRQLEKEFLTILSRNATWVKSLSIHSHDSFLPMKFAESCDRLESFTIQGHSLLNTTEYWESCRRVIIRNQPHLRSLSMINWMSQYRGSPAMPHIAWNPISECSQALNLRTLKLENSCIGLKDLPAFWKICERLEELTLDSANLELSLLPSLASNRKRVRNEYDDEELLESSSLLPSPPPSPYSSSSCSNTTFMSSMDDAAADDDGHDKTQHILFPRLRKLRICGMNWVEPIDQLYLLIQPCPVLQTLYWQIDKRKSCPSAEFVELFLASTWPDLDSITITDQCKPLFSRDQYHQILQGFSNPFSGSSTVVMDSKRASEQDQQQQGQPRNRKPLRRLDIKIKDGILTTTLDLLCNQHFATIQKIDLIYCEGNTSRWSIQILISCPGLEYFRAKGIKAQDILQAQQQQQQQQRIRHPHYYQQEQQEPLWACRRLRELTIFIDMGFQNNGPNRRFTFQELEQCRTIFRLLAGLKELQTLDMLTSYSFACDPCELNYHRDPQHPRHLLVPLPLRLKAGLGLLVNSTKLEKVWFWGGKQYLPRRELNWMIHHWKRLKNLAGGGRIKLGAPKSLEEKYIWSKPIHSWLNELGISTLGTRYELYSETNMSFREEIVDCCETSDNEDEDKVEQRKSK